MGYIAIVAGIFLLELIIKNKAERKLKEHPPRKLFGGKLLLRKYHNHGAAFNLGERTSFVVAAVSVALTAAITVVFLATLGQKGNRLLKLSLGVLLGGAFSNTYDRLHRKYVVDYFSFGAKSPKLRGIVYNISDFCILIGCLLWTLTQTK